MNKKINVMGLCLVTSLASAGNIPIPDGSFEGVNAAVYPPLVLGTSTGLIGSWTGSMTGLLSLGGSLQSGLASSLGGPAAANGSYDLAINIPADLSISANLSQTLATQFIPNATYTLSVALDQGTIANVLAGSTLSLEAGTNVLASLNGTYLAGVIDTQNGFQTVSLTYTTSNSVPTNGIGISLNVTELAGIGGSVYVDNFQLSVTPLTVQLNPVIITSSTNLTFSGSGGTTNTTYELIGSTNLMSPPATWTPVATNQFNASGNFTQSIPISHQIPYKFFRLMLP